MNIEEVRKIAKEIKDHNIAKKVALLEACNKILDLCTEQMSSAELEVIKTQIGIILDLKNNC